MDLINSEIQTDQSLTKKALALKLGVSRSGLYYQRKRQLIDEEVKMQIESVMADHPRYGHKRIALKLKLNKKRIRRVMKKFNLKPIRRRINKARKKADEGKAATKFNNLIKGFCPIRPNVVWVSDFTYIKYQGRFIYLATIMDLYTREIIGWNISRFHNQELVLGALTDALKRNDNLSPLYFHSDQGSEYDSEGFTNFLENLKTQISMSKKASPWENGYQESFYSEFKMDLGDQNRFDDLAELIEAIHQTIYYYNNQRIHTKLKMSPVEFKAKFYRMTLDNVSKKRGT
jgi:putative transposase